MNRGRLPCKGRGNNLTRKIKPAGRGDTLQEGLDIQTFPSRGINRGLSGRLRRGRRERRNRRWSRRNRRGSRGENKGSRRKVRRRGIRRSGRTRVIRTHRFPLNIALCNCVIGISPIQIVDIGVIGPRHDGDDCLRGRESEMMWMMRIEGGIHVLLYTTQVSGCAWIYAAAICKSHCRAIAACSRLSWPRHGGGSVHGRCHAAVQGMGAAAYLRSMPLVLVQPVISWLTLLAGAWMFQSGPILALRKDRAAEAPRMIR